MHIVLKTESKAAAAITHITHGIRRLWWPTRTESLMVWMLHQINELTFTSVNF